jgi:hypothetical protein
MPFPVELKHIIETEKALGLEFPESFKIKMMRENGGELMTDEDDWLLFPFLDKTDNKRISRTCNHIVQETENAKQGVSFPKNGIAIASNGCGDNLILLPLENNPKQLQETIYLWLHETGEIIEIAESIDELTEE